MDAESLIVRHFNAGRPRWGDAEYLLADVAGILAGKPHPARPTPQSIPRDSREQSRLDEVRQRRIAEKRAREAARDQEQGGGE